MLINLRFKKPNPMRSVTKTPSPSHTRAVKRAKPFRDPVLVDEMISGCRILARIGEGGTADVYVAETEKRKVAIKLAKTKLHNRFIENEKQKLESFDHPAVLKPIASGTFYGRTYMVTEHVEGENLSTAMGKTGIMPWERARKILLDLCDALHELHKRGIVHRDVKPGNILLSSDGSLKLIDFGLAEYSDKCLPREKIVEGTPKYIAPEVAAGLKHDHRTDIYSVGMVMYGLVTGTMPFNSDSDSETLWMQINLIPKLPSKASPHLFISTQFDSVAMKALDKDPAKRYLSMSELRAAIEDLALYAGPIMSYAHYETAGPEENTKRFAMVG